MDSISEQLSAHISEPLVEISMGSIRGAIEKHYPEEKQTPKLTSSQAKQELQRLFREDQAERTSPEAFEVKVKRVRETGLDDDLVRRQECAAYTKRKY